MEDTTMLRARPVSHLIILYRHALPASLLGRAWQTTESKRSSEPSSGKQSIRSCVGPPYSDFHKLILFSRKSLLKNLGSHVKEHYPNASYGVYPIEDDSKIALLVVANKYSPNNFWYVSLSISSLMLIYAGMVGGAHCTSSHPPHPHFQEASKSTYTTMKMEMSVCWLQSQFQLQCLRHLPAVLYGKSQLQKRNTRRRSTKASTTWVKAHSRG